jgi:hypothetical protein
MIKKSQLGAEYVFLPTLVEFTSPVTTTDVFATKLVYFERVEDHLYLMEQMEGRTITDPYAPVSILAQFPVVAEDEFTITFDFKSGFDALIMNWGDYDDTDLPDSSVPIAASYLENFAIEKKRFSFDHIAQISLPSFFEDVLRTVRFNYAFIPSERDAISWLVPDEEERFGYFLTRPTYERGSGEAYQVVHHWDIARPVFFHISANTPPEYYPAVESGILAWNEAFGSEVIQVRQAPAGVVSGTPGYNVVQWVGFDEAPGAYTIWHAHPRSGQILDAHVIFTSVFAVKSQDSARRILEILEEQEAALVPVAEEEGKENARRRLQIGLSGFVTQRLCDGRFNKPAREFLKWAASGVADDETILKISKLFVKGIVMHEVGHALGLRHNFHGNLGSQIPLNADKQSLREAIASGAEQGPLPSASIMDYLDFQDVIRMHKPGEYDTQAISWAYGLGKDLVDTPPYCTDDDVFHNVDCDMFDGGADPIPWRQGKMKDYLTYLSGWLTDTVLDETESEQKDEPDDDEYFWHLATLLDYLNNGLEVLELQGLNVEERRGRAAAVVGEFLRAADSHYNSVLNLAAEKLQTRLLSADPGDEKTMIVMNRLQGLRDSSVVFILDRLSSLIGLGYGGLFEINEANQRDLEISERRHQLNQSTEVLRPLAQGLLSIAVNHVALDQPAEPFTFRMDAARLVSFLEEEKIKDLKTTALGTLQANIAALEDALSNLYDDQEIRRYEELIQDERMILVILGGRPVIDGKLSE